MSVTWTEGRIHLAMRHVLRHQGWLLVAGEYPGGSDHELYPLNVVDPAVARDDSPDPRRHSLRELIPDLVALRGRDLFIGEAKVHYDSKDRQKLELLVSERREDLVRALEIFAIERNCPKLLPAETLILCPTLVFRADNSTVPLPTGGLSYLRIVSPTEAFFEGQLRNVGS
jgi:hypothetical protein